MEATDRDAMFVDLVAARYASLVRFGHLLLGDRGQAEDLAQAALMRAYGARHGVRDPANAEAYTRKIMVRLSVRWRRRPWRGEVPSGLVSDEVAADQFAGSDLAITVRQALQRLPAHQRATVVLRYYVDLTPAETAKVLGCSVGTVKSRTHRALLALRAAGLLDPDHDPHSSEGRTHG